MPDIIIDGKTRVAYVTSISNRNAPTTAELNAGTLLHDFLTPDGLVGFAPETADVDSSSLSSTFDTKQPGRASYSGTMLRLKKQSPTADAVYNALVREFATNIVIRRGVAATTAWTAADKVSVYPSVCGEVRDLDPEPNSVQKYEVPVKISIEPSLRATVA
jgi:hypothetical protein